jgi:hypothetical protein
MTVAIDNLTRQVIDRLRLVLNRPGANPREETSVDIQSSFESAAMPQPPVKAANLALKFALELAAVAAFAYWGTTLHGTAVSALAAVVAPLAMVVLWGTFAAPRAQRRLSTAIRVPFELAVFALAAGALLAVGAPVPAAGLATLAVLNSVLLTRFDQWDR